MASALTSRRHASRLGKMRATGRSLGDAPLEFLTQALDTIGAADAQLVLEWEALAVQIAQLGRDLGSRGLGHLPEQVGSWRTVSCTAAR